MNGENINLLHFDPSENSLMILKEFIDFKCVFISSKCLQDEHSPTMIMGKLLLNFKMCLHHLRLIYGKRNIQ